SFLSSGSSVTHLSEANGQRVWNRHPVGGSIGEGTSPDKIIRSLFASGSVFGIADNSDFVYGCCGFVNNDFLSAISTIFPKYITITRSDMCRTTPRSCEINRYVKLSSRCNFLSRLITCA